ncbi:EH domain-containing protein 4 [Grus japonensis]|uniref:EH domain-containing protein 4 n=1 Tax=Grus japonensis TaxID=30415 RepID=A0ABC9W3Y5_GRUJA
MPAGSKTGPPLDKAKPISASVITYLRSRKTLRERELLQPERGVRRCKKLCRHQEPIPAGSKMDPQVAKAELISDSGSASEMHLKEAVTLREAHWSKLLAGPVDPWREEPTPEQVFWQDL